MSTKNHNEDNDPTSSGYEANISDEVSHASSIVKTKTAPSSNSTIETNNENDKHEIGVITIGCNTRDAGPGVLSDGDAEFGTIWIGYSVRDMGFEGYQALKSPRSEGQGQAEHIEDVGSMADRKDAGAGPSDDTSSRESRTCEQAQVTLTSSHESASSSCSVDCCCS
ncbi:hypothetical protein BDV06DRAFT_129419 [Aspergillus oleicola]